MKTLAVKCLQRYEEEGKNLMVKPYKHFQSQAAEVFSDV